MYESNGGQRLTLYVRRADFDGEQTAFRYQQSNGIGEFYWIDGPLGHALVGAAPRQQLLQAAQAVYHQLNI